MNRITNFTIVFITELTFTAASYFHRKLFQNSC